MTKSEMHVGWVTCYVPIILPSDEIKKVSMLAFKAEDKELDGCYIVRITKETPSIEMIVSTKERALQLYRFFSKRKKVVNLFGDD